MYRSSRWQKIGDNHWLESTNGGRPDSVPIVSVADGKVWIGEKSLDPDAARWLANRLQDATLLASGDLTQEVPTYE